MEIENKKDQDLKRWLGNAYNLGSPRVSLTPDIKRSLIGSPGVIISMRGHMHSQFVSLFHSHLEFLAVLSPHSP